MSKNTPFRHDYVGSFLRPETLKRARRDFEEGKISKEELTKVEDAAILDLVEKQKKAGYHVITDDERSHQLRSRLAIQQIRSTA